MLEKFYKLTQHCLKFLSHHALSHSKQTLFKKVTFNYVLLNRNSCLLLAVEKVAHVAHWYQNHHYKWFQWCGQRLGVFNQYLPFRNYLCSFTSSNEQIFTRNSVKSHNTTIIISFNLVTVWWSLHTTLYQAPKSAWLRVRVCTVSPPFPLSLSCPQISQLWWQLLAVLSFTKSG